MFPQAQWGRIRNLNRLKTKKLQPPKELKHLVSGAVKAKVREPLSTENDLVVIAEFKAWPEPKALTPDALRRLADTYGGFKPAARIIGGVSEGFVRQNAARMAKRRGKDRA